MAAATAQLCRYQDELVLHYDHGDDDDGSQLRADCGFGSGCDLRKSSRASVVRPLDSINESEMLGRHQGSLVLRHLIVC